MKRLLLIILINIFVLPFAVAQQTEVQIKGSISEIESGNLLLLAYNKKQTDTLAFTPIVSNNFSLKANIDRACVANLIVDGYGGGFVMIVEPGSNYEVTLMRDIADFKQSGHQQEELIQYQNIIIDNNTKIAELRSKIDEAGKERRFKTMGDLNKDLAELLGEAQDTLSQIVERNRGTVLSAYLITNGLRMTDLEEMETIYSKLDENERASQVGEVYYSMIYGIKKIDVNSIAPDFTLPDKDGKKYSLHSLDGKLKLIDFWASWCGPCRKENPNMIALFNDFKDKGLLIVGVSLDDNKKSWLKAVDEDGLEWLQLLSNEGNGNSVVNNYNIDAIPAIFILDSNNKIVAKNLRGEKLRDFVSNYLGSNN